MQGFPELLLYARSELTFTNYPTSPTLLHQRTEKNSNRRIDA
jgi:hypothetical protein